jgi:cytochrome P450
VRQDPSLVPSAFSEVLRYYPPVHAWGRRVTRDVEIEGVLIPQGSQAAILFGAGNRDERHYPNPDVFDVARNPADHLSFGYGAHSCAGQGLARMEGQARSFVPTGRPGEEADEHHAGVGQAHGARRGGSLT